MDLETTTPDPTRADAPVNPPAAVEVVEPESQNPPAAPTPDEVLAMDPDTLSEHVAKQAMRMQGKATIRDILAAIPEARALVTATAIRCLSAKRMMGSGKNGVQIVEDGVTQMKAAAFLAAYLDGLPVQTTMNLNVDASKDMPIEESLRRSPALVDALERTLTRAKANLAVQKTGGRNVTPAPSESSA